MPSFDVVSELNAHEVTNAVDQANRELAQRFDFKDTGARFELKDFVVTLHAQVDFQLKQMLEILEGKLVKRQVPLKALTRGKVEPAAGGRVRQRIELQQGISTEKAREIVKLIKGGKFKVQAQIQENQVRVFGRDRDELQAVVRFLREQDLGIHTQFVNYRP